MIQILKITPNEGSTSQVRPTCTCGRPAIAIYPCEQDSIVFCTNCGALTSHGRLVRDLPAYIAAAPIRWLGVSTRAECPLLAVSIPVRLQTCTIHELIKPESYTGTIIKISVDKCLIRLETPAGPAVLEPQQEIELAGDRPPLESPLPGIVEETVWPQGSRGQAYYKIRLVPLTIRRKTALETFFQALYIENTRCPKKPGIQNREAAPPPQGPTEVADPQPAVEPSATSMARPRLSTTDEDAVRMLCMASETHDPHISNHLNRISAYTAALARQLGLPPARVALLGTAAKLHDVGKLGVPDAILNKTGALTRDERTVMQEHTRFGGRILQASESELMRLAATIALRHHERYDGKGYPDGLAGEAIPIEARITSVADVFDALTTQRAYKPAWSTDQAVEFMQEQAGRAFDPAVIEAFLRVQGELERTQLRFMDDFRNIWTERRRDARRPTAPIPLSVTIAMPELTFSPHDLTGELHNLSAGGAKVLLRDITLDLFTMLVASRRYARLTCSDPPWTILNQVPCSITWVDYYSIPDPAQCLLGLSFQKEIPEVNQLLVSLSLE